MIAVRNEPIQLMVLLVVLRLCVPWIRVARMIGTIVLPTQNVFEKNFHNRFLTIGVNVQGASWAMEGNADQVLIPSQSLKYPLMESHRRNKRLTTITIVAVPNPF
jgi:hypothetical protein